MLSVPFDDTPPPIQVVKMQQDSSTILNTKNENKTKYT